MMIESAKMMIVPKIELPETAIPDLCRIHQVKELSFGSAACGEMGPDSDFDLLLAAVSILR